MTTAHARERRQFGKPIGEQQLIQQLLADCAIEINAARLLLLQAAHEIDQGRDARERISMVKVYAAEMLGRVADRAVQVFGGMGYCKDLPIERFYRDARIFRIFDGTSEIHRTVIARVDAEARRGALRRRDLRTTCINKFVTAEAAAALIRGRRHRRADRRRRRAGARRPACTRRSSSASSKPAIRAASR